jgi:hypothetical protein
VFSATKSLAVCLSIFLLATYSSGAIAQQYDSNDSLPLRLKRPDEGEKVNPSSNKSGLPLQGAVTRVGVIGEPEPGVFGSPTFDVSKAFPTPRIPLTGRVEGFIDTPPVTLPAKASFAPPAVYRGWIEKAHSQFSLQTSTMAPNRLVVVFDKYDDTGRTLSSFGLKFTTISKKELSIYDLSGAQVLIIDCGPGALSPQALMKIRDFVARGGYLFTTDWMLDRLDQLIFPGFIAWNGAMNSQKMYDASLYGQNPVLFKYAVSNAHWKMDIHCHLIRVLNKEAVRVLAVSRTLVFDDPDHQGILAVVFPFERGYVMHMTAHFDRSQQIIGYYLADPAPAIGIGLRQALAINFVVAGLTGVKP